MFYSTWLYQWTTLSHNATSYTFENKKSPLPAVLRSFNMITEDGSSNSINICFMKRRSIRHQSTPGSPRDQASSPADVYTAVFCIYIFSYRGGVSPWLCSWIVTITYTRINITYLDWCTNSHKHLPILNHWGLFLLRSHSFSLNFLATVANLDKSF